MNTRAGAALAAGAVASVVLAVAAIELGTRSDDQPTAEQTRRADSLAARASELARDDPRRAARLARRGYRTAPTPATEDALAAVVLANLDAGRIIEAHEGRLAALATSTHGLFTAGRGTGLNVWDRDSGALRATANLPAPARLVAATDNAPVFATIDRRGELRLWLVGESGRLHARRLEAPRRAMRATVALGFAHAGTQLLALDRRAVLRRWDTASGDLLRAVDLTDRIEAPQSGPGNRTVVAAGIAPDSPSLAADPQLALATADDRVFDIELDGPRARQVMAPADIPGRVTAVAVDGPFDAHVAVGSSRGAAIWDSTAQTTKRIVAPPAADVGFGGPFMALATGSGVGLTDTAAAAADGYARWTAAPAGRPATLVATSAETVAAAHVDGTVTVVDERRAATLLPSAEPSNGATFDEADELLLTDGTTQSVTGLYSIGPWSARRTDYGGHEYEPRRRFEPASDWWDADETFYVNDIASSDELVAAGGQDPDGTAVVLVWNAKTGEPLERLPLTTGGLDLEGIETVTQVELLPESRRLVAYNVAQETLLAWSTETWEQVGTVDIDPVSDISVSPDERWIAAARMSDEQSEAAAGHRRSAIVVIDAGDMRIQQETEVRNALRVAYAPDGESLALLTHDGMLSLRSPSGEERLTLPVRLGAPSQHPEPVAMAWRGDGRRIAVTDARYGTFLLDPRRTEVPPALPLGSDDASAVRAGFSPDGRILAVTSVNREDSYLSIEPTMLWRVDPGYWAEERMCQLAADCPGEKDRDRALGADAVRRAAVAYERGGGLWLAGTGGASARVATLPRDEWPGATVRWSPEGDVLAWQHSGMLHSLREGDRRPRSRFCPCAGFGFDGDELVALSADGSALLSFAPRQRWPRRTRIAPALPSEGRRLLAVAGGRAVVGASKAELTSAKGGPVELHAVGRDGRSRHLATDSGNTAVTHAEPSPDGDRVAYVSTTHGGYCYAEQSVAVLDLDASRIDLPAMPDDFGDNPAVRSVHFDGDGRLTASIAEASCDGSEPRAIAPQAYVHELRGERLHATGQRAHDHAPGGQVDGLLRGPVRNDGGLPELWLHGRGTGSDAVWIADEVSSAVARP